MVRLTGQPQLRIYIYPKVPAGFYAYRTAADNAAVKRIIESVRREGDRALQRYTRRFDRVRISGIRVELSELKRAARAVDPGLAAALETARRNIRKFAVRQLRAYRDFEFQIQPGVFTGQKAIPVERVGIYVPAGQYPLVSSLLMCAIPAQVAGVKEIAVCSPPSCRGSVHPAILGAADRIGIREIYRIGGAQAIAALAYGTATVKKVDKIVGPGNRYVAQAKKEVFGAVGVDFIAGPTEIMIIADESADPDLIAADLLAQAEHDREAVATVVTDSQCLAARINRAVAKQLAVLPSRNTAARAIAAHGAIIIVKEISQALHIANRKAPEHLELQVKNPVRRAARLTNYGSLFIGDKAAEALGDYSSGLNHTLPTNFGSRYTGGLGVRDFIKIQTTLRLTRNGLAWIGPAAEIFARTEGLAGHGRSIARRRENIQ